ncbi:MAG: dihydrolipoyl dehydrogenase [Burkholderiales bacterium]|nr:dihydrolipoyl dehydrogenase [Burkholderiales bacterium]
MTQTIEVKVPDIGDFKDVPVIEILVKPGDRVEAESGLITLESDKATMDIPAPAPGVVREIKLKPGDKVSQGTPILLLETGEAQPGAPVATVAQRSPASVQAEGKGGGAAAGAAQPAPAAGAFTGKADVQCDVVVLGSGPGGYSAAFRAADLGLATVLVERYPALGGVCLNVGCIPSKALLHVAAVMGEARQLASHGVAFGEPQIDLEQLRAWKSKVVGKLTSGLASMAKARKVTVVQGVGRFSGPSHMTVETAAGRKIVAFRHAIIAAGSQAARLPFLPQDPRIVDSTGALALPARPQRMLVIGGGIIGLEMGTVYSALGARLDVVEMLDGLMTGADRDLVAVWQKFNAKRFDNVMLKTRTTKVEATGAGLKVWFEGAGAPSAPQLYDLVLVSVGRTPNGRNVGADAAGVAVDERGFIAVDWQMRTNVPHIFAIGDIVGQPMLAHKAVHEGHVAAEVAAGQKSFFDARAIPSVAYTDPEIAWVGLTEEEAKKQGVKHGVAKFPWAASGRAIANGRDEGFTKLIFDSETHRVIGGGIVGTGAGDLISEIALAIEMGADAVDISRTIHPHPTLGESVGMAAELYEGVCTDLPPLRKH